MELNAKLTTLEDEVRLIKGEVKLILSEIRAAILNQDNPFSDSGQGFSANTNALDNRPPIRVVRVPANDEDEFEEQPLSARPPIAQGDVWEDLEPPQLQPAPPQLQPAQAFNEANWSPEPVPQAPPPPSRPAAATPEAAVQQRQPQGSPISPEEPTSPQPPASETRHQWGLMTIAGLCVWAEEAVKQVGEERLNVLLDLCEFTGNIDKESKEALLRLVTIVPADAEKNEKPSVNECLVVLHQLDALIHGEEKVETRLRKAADRCGSK